MKLFFILIFCGIFFHYNLNLFEKESVFRYTQLLVYYWTRHAKQGKKRYFVFQPIPCSIKKNILKMKNNIDKSND